MSAVLVSKENNRAVFTMELSAEEFEEAIELAYRKNKNHFSLPGFRKGRVPRSLLERNFGEELFYEDALNEVLPKAFDEAVEELDLFPVAQPDVDVDEIVKGQAVKMKFEVDIKPEPKLGDYEGEEIRIPKLEVSDEMVERRLNEEREQNARMVPVERPVEDGDIATIDFEGFLGEETFEGGKADDHELVIGSGSFIPGFEEGVIGHEIGDNFDLELTFPEEYQEDLAGKDVRFNVTIKQLKEKQLPEADDDFALDISEFDTLEELKADYRKQLEDEAENRRKIEKEGAAVNKLIEVSELEIPESMIVHQIDHMVQDMEREIAQFGIGLEQYMAMMQKDMATVREDMRPQAVHQLKAELLLDTLTEKLDPEVSDEELDRMIEEELMSVPEDQKETYREMLKNSGDVLKDRGKTQKALEILLDSLEIVEVDPEELQKEMEAEATKASEEKEEE